MGQKRPAPEGVAAGSPSDCVALNATGLARVPDPRCTTLLAEKLPATITVDQSHLISSDSNVAKGNCPGLTLAIFTEMIVTSV